MGAQRYAVPTVGLRKSLGAHRADFVRFIGEFPYNDAVIPQATHVGRSMPHSRDSIRLRARPGLLLNVALVAWFGIMVMPCSVLASDAISLEASADAAVSPDCHGVHAEAEANGTAECCCDPLTIAGGEGPKTQRAELVAAPPLAVPVALAPLAAVVLRRAHPPPPIDVGPPVYLATQRFRI